MALTYSPIATTTLGANALSFTFSSIPNTYTDLVLIGTALSTQAGTSSNTLRAVLNGDTGTNYSDTYVYGDGTTAASGRDSNFSYASLGDIAQTSATSYPVAIAHFMNYSNTTTYKTILVRGSWVNSSAQATVNLWRSTAAINSIQLFRDNSLYNIKAGSTFTLYGIKAA